MNRIQRVRRFRLASLALSLGAILTVSSLPAAVSVMAAGNGTVRIDPATEPVAGPGATFTVNVISNADAATSGIQASVTFDKSLLQIVSVGRPATEWGTAGTFVGPTGNLNVAANKAAAIAAANGSGKLATVAANMDPPATLASGVDQTFLLITFQVIACPVAPATTTPLGLPTGNPADTTVNDAAGDPVAITTAGSVVTPCSTNTGNTKTHVTSSLDAGFLALEVAPTFSIPLLRQVTNAVDVPVKVFSDGVWTLNVSDAMPSGKIATDRGHMTQATPYKRLDDPMTAQVAAQPVRTLDQPLANTNVTTGAGTATPVVTLRQLVKPVDPPASYSIVLVFTATSGF